MPINESQSTPYRRLLGYAFPYWPFFAVSVLGNFIYAASQAGFAELMKYFMEALDGGPAKYVVLVPLAGIVLAFARGLGFFLGNFFISQVGQRVVHDLRRGLFAKIIDLPASFFARSQSGDLLSMMTFNIQLVNDAVTRAITTLFREGFTVIALFTYLLLSNWKLTLIFLVLGPVIAGLVAWVGKRLRRISTRIQDSMGELSQASTEVIQGQQMVKNYAGQQLEKDRFAGINRYNLKQSIKFELTNSLNSPVLQMFMVLGLALIMYLVLQLRSEQSPSELIAYVTAAAMLPKPVKSLGTIYGQMQRGIAAAESVFALFDEQAERTSGQPLPEPVQGSVSFNQLTFRYSGNDDKTLDNISIHIPSGKTTALVGSSGSGKSTLINLLLGSYRPETGNIEIDGCNIEDVALPSLRSHIAQVSQTVVLFNDTVANNIAYGELRHCTQQQIEAAAKAANAHDFICNLPMGYQTLVGEQGDSLSGGQRQRLAIARAILKNAPILILDEATSALDNESEHLIQEALDDFMQNRTTIVVAHRLSTIENADQIVVMDQGRVVEVGQHQELLDANGYYARLHSRDFSEEKS